jgi:ribosomal protein S18 acetylase RimI-like enzyme
VLSLVVSRLREAVSSHETLVVLARATGEAPRSDGATATLRPLGAEDATLYARVIGTDSAASFRARLSPATRCYAVEDEGRVLHSSWVTTDCAWTRELRAFVCVGSGDAYVYESYTRAEARGRGVYPFALREICRALAYQKVARLWVAVEASNAPSLRAVSKAGFERVFAVAYGRRLGRVTIELPEGVKADTAAVGRRKKTRIWLSWDGAI